MSDVTIATPVGPGVAGLQAGLRGELLQPGDEGYNEARKVYNGAIDKHPALIIRCAAAADVIAAVNFAREHQLTLAVRRAATASSVSPPATTVCSSTCRA